MAHALSFDTLKFTKDLVKGGFSQEQAEAQAIALADVLESSDVATKNDIESLKTEVKGEITAFRNEVDVKLSKLESKLIIWFGGLLIAQSSALISIFKFFH